MSGEMKRFVFTHNSSLITYYFGVKQWHTKRELARLGTAAILIRNDWV
jgi:hypothetical protein